VKTADFKQLEATSKRVEYSAHFALFIGCICPGDTDDDTEPSGAQKSSSSAVDELIDLLTGAGDTTEQANSKINALRQACRDSMTDSDFVWTPLFCVIMQKYTTWFGKSVPDPEPNSKKRRSASRWDDLYVEAEDIQLLLTGLAPAFSERWRSRKSLTAALQKWLVNIAIAEQKLVPVIIKEMTKSSSTSSVERKRYFGFTLNLDGQNKLSDVRKLRTSTTNAQTASGGGRTPASGSYEEQGANTERHRTKKSPVYVKNERLDGDVACSSSRSCSGCSSSSSSSTNTKKNPADEMKLADVTDATAELLLMTPSPSQQDEFSASSFSYYVLRIHLPFLVASVSAD
jgi:hypothetical protein